MLSRLSSSDHPADRWRSDPCSRRKQNRLSWSRNWEWSSVPWNIGTINAQSTAAGYYTAEIANKSTNDYVGLISPSDFGFAVSGDNDTARNTCLNATINSNYSSTCRTNNWLNFSANAWTITAQGNSTNRVIGINSNGYTELVKTNTSRTYRPVVYLNGNVYLSTGDGSSSNQYELE